MFSNNRVLIISGLVVFFKTEIKYTLIVHDRNKFNACIIYTRINEVGTVIKCRMFLIKYNLVYTKFEFPYLFPNYTKDMSLQLFIEIQQFFNGDRVPSVFKQ